MWRLGVLGMDRRGDEICNMSSHTKSRRNFLKGRRNDGSWASHGLIGFDTRIWPHLAAVIISCITSYFLTPMQCDTLSHTASSS